jgi:peptide/nickel transport system substrate-binding protein
MKRKAGWAILSLTIVLSLVLSSCGPAAVEGEEEEVGGGTVIGDVTTPEAEETEEEAEEVVEEEVEMVQTSLGTTREEPRYGGSFTHAQKRPIMGFDPLTAYSWYNYAYVNTHENLFHADWLAGPIGKNISDWTIGEWMPPEGRQLQLVTDWEYEVVDDTGVFTLDVREGVRFHNISPVNGREMTAEDVAYSLQREWYDEQSRSYYTSTEEQRPYSIEAIDKWTVQIECNPSYAESIFITSTGDTDVVAQEMVEEWGDLEDWRATAGTGPYVLIDYVPSSSLSLERNPDYWRSHPLYPEYKMPFIDDIKILIIPDTSTRLAAFRTGKLDFIDEVEWRDSDSLMSGNSDLERRKTLRYVSNYVFWMRMDREPFDDIRVRQALWHAVDRQAIVDFYNGNAWLDNWPVPPYPQYERYRKPVEERDTAFQDLYEYDPEKAKQLLTDAGYPNGFQTWVDCDTDSVDEISVIKSYFDAINVDMEIRAHEYSIYRSIWRGLQHEQMVYGYRWASPPFIGGYTEGNLTNASMISDPRIEAAEKQIYELWLEPDKQAEVIRDVMYDVIAPLAPLLPNVGIQAYIMWWPWLKDYSGEWCVGYVGNWPDAQHYIWIDTEMKEEMGY